MRPEPRERMDDRAYKVWRLKGGISSILSGVITVALINFCNLYDWPRWIWIGATLLTFVETFLLVYVVPAIRMHRWRYEVFAEEVDLQHGIFITKRSLIPMVRVQHVDTEQGPFLRKYGLSTVILFTAAGKHEIPALSQEVADRLRDQIARLARVTEDDI